MNATDVTRAAGSAGWDLPTLAWVWDYRTGAIVAGADRIEALPEAERADSLAALALRVTTLAADLDDGWLVFAAFFMADDLYRSFFHQFRWSEGVHEYIASTANVLIGELTRRGYVLHYVMDGTHPESTLDQTLTYLPAVLETAGLFVTGPQLMALEAMQMIDHLPRDVTAIPSYRTKGHEMADELIARCHRDRRSSAYLNLDVDDDAPALSMDAALSQRNSANTIVIFRTQPPVAGSVAELSAPPGVDLPKFGDRNWSPAAAGES